MSSVKKTFRIVAIICFALLAAWSIYNVVRRRIVDREMIYSYRYVYLPILLITLLGILYLVLFLLGVIIKHKAPIIAACIMAMLLSGESIRSNLDAVSRGLRVSDATFISAGLKIGAMLILLIFTMANRTLYGGILAGVLQAAQALTSLFVDKTDFLKQFAAMTALTRTTWIAQNALTVLGFIALGVGLHKELIKREKTVRQKASVFIPLQSKTDRLLRLKDLLDKETITAEDFEAKKSEILK